MWPSHLSLPDLGLIHLQQPENFGLYMKPPFHHREKHSMGADSPDLGPCVLLPFQAALPIAQQATGCHDADGASVASWVCVAGFPRGSLLPAQESPLTAHTTVTAGAQLRINRFGSFQQRERFRSGSVISHHFTSFLPVEISELFHRKRELPMEISDSVEITFSSRKFLFSSIQEFGYFFFCPKEKILWPQLSQALQHLFCTPGLGCSQRAASCSPARPSLCQKGHQIILGGRKYPS